MHPNKFAYSPHRPRLEDSIASGLLKRGKRMMDGQESHLYNSTRNAIPATSSGVHISGPPVPMASEDPLGHEEHAGAFTHVIYP
mmetsp:Transcript_27263/g.62592  ORF Transcript_27263/g.62592 Transcript_27263/m.62592 type:complete len:84 (-) Transcript_27263:260-511(-)